MVQSIQLEFLEIILSIFVYFFTKKLKIFPKYFLGLDLLGKIKKFVWKKKLIYDIVL
tara:strand:- start:604 stop:774 length:171 start_codon:yes stop_codon:yes gene_type:complete